MATQHLHSIFLKKQKQETLKISKRNLPNVRMAGWRHWLTKYTDKESTINLQHCYISQNHPYKSSSDILYSWHNINLAATYV